MRKIIVLLCTLFLLICVCALGEENHPVLSPAQGDNGLWGYKNVAGEWAFEPQWRYVGIFRDGVAVVEWDRTDDSDYTCGILRDDGTWILPRCDYQVYDRFYYEDDFDIINPDEQALLGGRENGFLWIVTSTREELMGLYLIQTDTLVMPRWNEVLFSMEPEDNVIFPVCDPETYLWGYVDWYGEVVIPCQYEYADCFTGGYAAVSGGTGIIDPEGNPVDAKITLESVEEIHKEGLQVTLAARIRIDSKGTGPVNEFYFFEETPIAFETWPHEKGIAFEKCTPKELVPLTPLEDGVHTLILTSPWGIDYAAYIEKGGLHGKVNCGAWVDVEIDLSE